MLYTVKLKYCFRTDAHDLQDAYAKARKYILDNPQQIIDEVWRGQTRPSGRSLLGKLIFGV